MYTVRDTQRDKVLARVGLARNFGERLFGLARRRTLDLDEGLWLRPCNGIHTFGMRFPLDVVVIDRHNRVLSVVEGLRPNRILLPRRGWRSTLELAAGAARGLETGTLLTMELIQDKR